MNVNIIKGNFIMRPLYQISMDLQLLMTEANSEANENDGEISEILFKKLENLEGEKDIKIGNICRFYKSLHAEADMIRQEEKNLSDRRKVVENKADSLKKYLSCYIEDGEKFSDETSKISWRKSESVEIKGIEFVPTLYQKISVSPDKIALKAAIKKGETFEGISIVSKQSIQIK